MALLRNLRRTTVFYPMVAAAIIVPNLVLGVYGYVTISSQQSAGESQVRQAYESVVDSLAGSLQRELRRLEQVLPDSFDIAAEGHQVAAHAARLAEEHAWLSGCYFVTPERELCRPTGLPEADQPVEDLPASVAAAVRQFATFETDIWPQLPDPLRDGHLPLWSDEAGSGEAICMHPVKWGVRDAWLVAWLDMTHVRTEIATPLLKTLQTNEDVTVELEAGVPPGQPLPEDPDWLVQMRVDESIAPFWVLRARAARLDEFRQTSSLAATIYVALTAIFVPFIGLGTFIMIRTMIKDVRDARQKTDFVSRVTHELKTPLTSIRMFVETLQMGGADSQSELERCLDIIGMESERLQKLIDRLLDFGKMERGTKVFTIRDDNIEQVVRDTIDFFRRQAQKVGGVIRLYIERDLPVFGFDRDAIREVLLNLLENALKYSVGEKLVAIRVTRTRWRDQDCVQIQVIDNGVGIRKDDLKRIFDKFYRVDDTLTKGIDGSGLGLSLSREIAKSHGGDILIESQHGHGSKFTLVLPLGYDAPPPKGPAPRTSQMRPVTVTSRRDRDSGRDSGRDRGDGPPTAATSTRPPGAGSKGPRSTQRPATARLRPPATALKPKHLRNYKPPEPDSD